MGATFWQVFVNLCLRALLRIVLLFQRAVANLRAVRTKAHMLGRIDWAGRMRPSEPQFHRPFLQKPTIRILGKNVDLYSVLFRL